MTKTEFDIFCEHSLPFDYKEQISNPEFDKNVYEEPPFGQTWEEYKDSQNTNTWQSHVPEAVKFIWDLLEEESKVIVYYMALQKALGE